MQVLKLPKSGQAMEEGTIVEWTVDVGEEVAAGDPVVIFETDKMTSEIAANEDGVLLEVAVEEDETVPIGTELGRVGSPDEADAETETADAASIDAEQVGGAAESGSADQESPVEATAEPVRATPTARRMARERGVDAAAVAADLDSDVVRPEDVEAYAAGGRADDTGDEEILGSPRARVVATDHGVDVEAVGAELGTARVREADVERFVAERESSGPREFAADAEPAVSKAGAAEPTPDVGGPRTVAEDRTLDGAAGVMFDRMSDVAENYASTTTVQRVDVTELLDLYDRLRPVWESQGDGLSLTAFVVRAVAQTLPDYPELNAEILDGETLRIYEDVNVGIAVNTDHGLLVPTIYDAADRSVRDTSDEIDRLAAGARNNDLDHDEMQNGTFTVSNAGSLGAYMNTPQINPPQTAILGVCSVFDDVGVVDGEVEPRKMMHLCLTYDHRVVEGAVAVGFLGDVAAMLESPEALLS